MRRTKQMKNIGFDSNRIENEVNLEQQFLIDKMLRIRRPRDAKKLLNNPPEKETYLKDPKDTASRNNMKFAYASGRFGPNQDKPGL